jgi:hypothetical protein
MYIKRFIKFFSSTLILIAGTITFIHATPPAICQKKYSGIRPDDKDGRKGLLNPERGFRWENRIGSFKPKWKDERWLDGIKDCKNDGLTMTQAYCELIDYCNMERIPEKQIKRLEESFAAVRKSGIKLLLCFRYEMDVRDKKGPTEEIILSHIKQLKPILQKNMDIIAVFQTGFVGLYGEWHRSYHKLDKNPVAQEKILRALLDILPSDRKLVIRYPRHKNTFVKRVSNRQNLQPITSKEAHTMLPEARIGFADHGFMVAKNDAGTFAPRPSKDYDYMSLESLFVPMDAELFWASNRPWGVAKDDGLEAIKRLWEHHYTLLSYAHNHTLYEGTRWKEKYNALYSIDEWKKDELDPEFLRKNDIPFSSNYFKDANGKYVSRTVFEFIRDHLGYRLELQSSSYPETAIPEKEYKATIKLVNRGFAAPVNPRSVYLVLIDKDKVYKIGEAQTDVRKWYPCDPQNRKMLSPLYALDFATKLFPKVKPGKYKLGIWLPDNSKTLQNDARYAIRLANREVSWWTGEKNNYGVNIIGDITVK